MAHAIHQHRLADLDATKRAAAELAALLQAGDSLGLIGDLGAGKTQFVKGLARGLGLTDESRVTSPTFTIVNQHPSGRLPLHHIDLYRIDDERELTQLGLEELFDDGVVAIEWCDKFPVLPSDHLEVRLATASDSDSERILDAHGTGPRSRELCAMWADRLGRVRSSG